MYKEDVFVNGEGHSGGQVIWKVVNTDMNILKKMIHSTEEYKIVSAGMN